MNTPYITRCNVCQRQTWYESEQRCHMQFVRKELCDLGHTHEVLDDEGCLIFERCEGTLRIIKKEVMLNA